MKIAIDISQVVYGTGVSFYTRNLVRALARLDRKNDYLLIGYSQKLKKELADFALEIREINPKFKVKLLSLPITAAEMLGNRFRFFGIGMFFGRFDVFHSSDWIQPKSEAAKVTTIHDLSFFSLPETASPKITAVMKRKLELVKREVDLVIAVSNSTSKDIIKYLKINPNKIKVIYEAPAEEFCRVKPSLVQKTKNKYRVEGKYLLSVANLDPRKNLKRIIEAFVQVRNYRSDLSLVITGKSGWGERGGVGISWINDKSVQDKVIFTDYIGNEDLSAFYSGAECLVYPSLVEGFGLPVLEAMKCGCPVVTSNVSSLPEVAGEAAVMVNPNNAAEIAAGVRKVLFDQGRYISKGYRQAEKFSWKKSAEQTLKAYRTAFQSKQDSS